MGLSGWDRRLSKNRHQRTWSVSLSVPRKEVAIHYQEGSYPGTDPVSTLVMDFQPPKPCRLSHIFTGSSGLLGLGAGREPVTREGIRHRGAGAGKYKLPRCPGDALKGQACSLKKRRKKPQLPSFVIFSQG